MSMLWLMMMAMIPDELLLQLVQAGIHRRKRSRGMRARQSRMVTVSGAPPRAVTVLDCLAFTSLGRFPKAKRRTLAQTRKKKETRVKGLPKAW